VLGSGLVGVVLGAAIVGLALFAMAFLQADENSFSVSIENDGDALVILKQCDTHCSAFHEEARLLPNEKIPVNTVADVPNWWRVYDGSGRTLGCLPLLFGRKMNNAIVRTSQVQDCPE
jgi:hypothetical protein